MDPRWVRTLGIAVVCLGAVGPTARAGLRSTDPNQVIPLEQVAPAQRQAVAEVIRDHTLHRRGKADTFPCHPRLYLKLLNEPTLTLALWKDLGPSPAQLQQVGPASFQGTDGAGASATWEFVLRSPRLHVLLCDLDYTSPRGNARLRGRIVLIVRSGFFRAGDGDFWVQHEIEAFVKVDSKGWKAVAATLRPLVERVLEDQVQEAGWFVSLMGRLVQTYPNWAVGVAASHPQLRPELRSGFRDLVAQTRKPDASTGRPALAENAPAARATTRLH